MRPTQARPLRLVVLGVGAAAFAWALLLIWIDGGGHTPRVPWTVPPVLGVAASVVLIAGLPVRRWVAQGRRLAAGEVVDRRRLDPIVAARTLLLAVASAHAGAVLAGWYAGQALAEFADVPAGRSARVAWALAAAGASLVLALCGLLVQRWCRIPPEDGPDASSPA